MRVTRIIITRHQLDVAWNHRQELHAKYYGLSIFHLIGWKYQERKKKRIIIITRCIDPGTAGNRNNVNSIKEIYTVSLGNIRKEKRNVLSLHLIALCRSANRTDRTRRGTSASHKWPLFREKILS